MTTFLAATTSTHFSDIADLAKHIWEEHYTPIIGKEQVDYMVGKFQTSEAMQKQASEGYIYFLIVFENEQVGYLSIKKNESDLFLSKIYVQKEFRGRKIGKSALEFVESKAKEFNCNSVSLTVNKNNTNSIKAYEKVGFEKNEAIVMDIGNGFVMDDYRMVKNLASK